MNSTASIMRRTLALSICTSALLVCETAAQTLADIREEIRENLHDSHFAAGFSTLIASASELELVSGSYFFDDHFDTQISVFALPWSHTFSGDGESPWGLYVEAAIGYAEDRQKIADIWQGALPGLETRITSKSWTISGLAGAGVEFEVDEGFTLTPIIDLGLAHLENKATYVGDGADFTHAILDDIALNWNAWTVMYGAAGMAQWKRELEGDREFTLIARYDVRWTDSFHTDDRAQEFSARNQFATLRMDLTGPTGMEALGGMLRWRGTLGYREMVEGDLEGLDRYGTIGAGLELLDAAPFRISLDAALIIGEEMYGYSVGLGLRF